MKNILVSMEGKITILVAIETGADSKHIVSTIKNLFSELPNRGKFEFMYLNWDQINTESAIFTRLNEVILVLKGYAWGSTYESHSTDYIFLKELISSNKNIKGLYKRNYKDFYLYNSIIEPLDSTMRVGHKKGLITPKAYLNYREITARPEKSPVNELVVEKTVVEGINRKRLYYYKLK